MRSGLAPEHPTLTTRELRDALGVHEATAAALPWAKERPWRAETHVWIEDGLVIDLHDLDVPTALGVVEHALVITAALPSVCFVVGRGTHRSGLGGTSSRGLRGAPRNDSPLAVAVRGRLTALAKRQDHQVFTPRPGRLALVRDVGRASGALTGRLSGAFWGGAFAFGALLTWALPPVGLLLLATLVLIYRADRR